jgi:ABC-type sugar transport system substrate-binding protein
MVAKADFLKDKSVAEKKEILESVKAGKMAATVAQDPYAMRG